MAKRTARKKIFACDAGASRTKFIYGGNCELEFRSMSPYCAKVGSEVVAGMRELWGVASIESSWVSDLDGTYLMGASAEKYYGSELSNSERKFEKALYKCLATIGYLSELHSIENGASIAVGVLLPFDEYVTREQFVNGFRLAVQEFEYCGVEKSFELDKLIVRPEGTGVAVYGVPKNIDPKTSRIASAVIGHRNASWLVQDKDMPQMEESSTVDLGFRWLVQEVKKATGFKDELEIARHAFEGSGHSDIQDAVKRLKALYWSQLKAWLSSHAPVDCVILSGGTSLLLQEELMGLYGGRCVWPDKLTAQVERSGEDSVMSCRFADVLGLYKILEAKIGAAVR